MLKSSPEMKQYRSSIMEPEAKNKFDLIATDCIREPPDANISSFVADNISSLREAPEAAQVLDPDCGRSTA